MHFMKATKTEEKSFVFINTCTRLQGTDCTVADTNTYRETRVHRIYIRRNGMYDCVDVAQKDKQMKLVIMRAKFEYKIHS